MRRARLIGSAVLGVAVAMLSAGRAGATSYSLTLSTDPSLGTIMTIPGNPRREWRSTAISFDPITLTNADELTVHVSFTGGRSLQLEDEGDADPFPEQIQFVVLALPFGYESLTTQSTTTLTSLTGVEGDLDVVLPLTGEILGPLPGIRAVIRADLTDTKFRFDGFSMTTTELLFSVPHPLVPVVTVSSIQLRARADAVSVVPEPSAVLLLAACFVVAARRTRTRRWL